MSQGTSRTLLRRFVIWSLLVLLLGGGFGWLVVRGLHIDTNVLSLLPATEKDPVVEDAIKRLAGHVGQKTVFLFGAKDLITAKRAAAAYLGVLETSGEYSEIQRKVPQRRQQAFFRFYQPYRTQLLAPKLRQKLTKPGGASAHLQAILRRLYGPMSTGVSGLLAKDPLLLLPAYLQGLPSPPGQLRLVGDVMVARSGGKVYVFAAATAKRSPFSRAVQKTQATLFAMANAAMRAAAPNAQCLSTGAIYFAQAGGASAEKEISTIGLGSMLGVLLLLLLVFRSPRQLLLASLPLGVGFVAAWSACVAIFGKIHLLTLVFGASLIGVCIDYAFHYFAEQRLADERWTPQEGLARIMPGISLGALTSAMGYLGLALAPFPGLRQMALFSCVGLLTAYGTVVCWFPLLGGLATTRPKPWLLKPTSRLIHFWQRFGHQGGSRVGLLLLALVSLVGIWQLRPNDDVRLLLHAPASLVKVDRQVKTLLGSFDSNRFFLVEGKTPEQVLQRTEALSATLGTLVEQKKLGFLQSISSFVPSQSQQRADKAQLRKRFGGKAGALAKQMQRLGFAATAQQRALQDLVAPIAAGLTIARWQGHEASGSLRHLWLGRTARGHAGVVLLGGNIDEAAMQALERPKVGVHYINKVDDVSSLMRRYRLIASWLVALAYACIGLLVVVRYGWRHGLLVLLPPAMAALVALGAVGWMGQPLQLFHLLALLLVLGIGIDYTIFFAEAEAHWQATLLAVILSAATTLLSFGLLALSQTPLLRAFGSTILIGILVALCLSPLALPKAQAASPQQD